MDTNAAEQEASGLYKFQRVGQDIRGQLTIRRRLCGTRTGTLIERMNCRTVCWLSGYVAIPACYAWQKETCGVG